MNTKRCVSCNEDKDISLFCNLKASGDGKHYYCKGCLSVRLKKWRVDNPEKAIKYNYSQRSAAEKLLDREKSRERYKNDLAYRTKKIESVKISASQRREKINAYMRLRWKNDPNYKLRHSLKNRLYEVMAHKGIVKKKSILEYLGCSPSYLKDYIESLWKEGMNWENYSYKGWHIDHIIPCASFDLTKEEEIYKCFNYRNLQPLWAEDNLKKSDKVITVDVI